MLMNEYPIMLYRPDAEGEEIHGVKLSCKTFSDEDAHIAAAAEGWRPLNEALMPSKSDDTSVVAASDATASVQENAVPEPNVIGARTPKAAK